MIWLLVNNSTKRLECIWENDDKSFVSSSRSTVIPYGDESMTISDLNLTDHSSINYMLINGEIKHSPLFGKNVLNDIPIDLSTKKQETIKMLSEKLLPQSSIKNVHDYIINNVLSEECRTILKSKSKTKDLSKYPLVQNYIAVNNLDDSNLTELCTKIINESTNVINQHIQYELQMSSIRNQINNCENIENVKDIVNRFTSS